MFLGVCGGIADYLGTDPTLVRLVFVVAALLGGPGLLAYCIAALVIPNRPSFSAFEPQSLHSAR